MSEPTDQRALKKARTREHVRTVAQRMFAEGSFDSVTIADIAREADVAVQTIFNHFATKEELFFDGRLPWADGPADAVRNRPAGVSPLAALRRHLVEGAGHYIAVRQSADGIAFTEALDACPALAAYEQRVLHEAEVRLSATLAEAWETDPEPGSSTAPAGGLAAPVTAAVWLSASRVVVVEQRRLAEEQGVSGASAADVERLLDAVLADLQSQLGGDRGSDRPTGRPSDTGWPPAEMRRAG